MDATSSQSVEPHRGTLILVLGILGLVVCMPCGIVAWVMANGDLKKMGEGRMDKEGEGMTKAGKICGIIATILAIIGLLIFVVVFLFLGVTGVTTTTTS